MRGVLAALTLLMAIPALAAAPAAAQAVKVGERHRTIAEPSAALRDAEHRPQLRLTLWYPAKPDALETALAIGPPDKPIFLPGTAAADAPWADGERRPLILLSHGFGGSARVMGWMGTALARRGYVVLAVDHPGNNGADTMTVAGAALVWDRPEDLRHALDAVLADPDLARHIDPSRIGVAGFSIGGFTALAEVGAPVGLAQFEAYCTAHAENGVCKPQLEFPVDDKMRRAAFADPAFKAEVARADGDHSDPRVRAAFVMAPVTLIFDPEGLKRMSRPVSIVLGDADPVVPPQSNGMAAAARIPGAKLTVLKGVRHYDFLAECSDAGRAAVPICNDLPGVSRAATHQAAIEAATAFFAETLR